MLREYAALINYLKATLRWQDNAAIVVPDAGYEAYDAFYRAEGSYSILTTCNTWTGNGLQQAEAPVSIWTPFAGNVVRHLEKRQ